MTMTNITDGATDNNATAAPAPPENRLLYTQSVQLDITPQYAYLGRNVRNQIPTNFSVASSPFKLENVPP